MANGEAMEPQRGVARVLRADDRDPEVGDREQASPDGIRVPRAGVEVRAFDEEEREHRRIPDPTNLGPESPAGERAVQIGDRLPFDQHAAGDPVVAGRERLDHHLDAEPLKARGDPAPVFEDVGNNR